MMDPDDIKLKMEIDAITHQIDHILHRIESVVPFNEPEDKSNASTPSEAAAGSKDDR